MDRQHFNRMAWVAVVGVVLVGLITLMSNSGRRSEVGVRAADVKVEALRPEDIGSTPALNRRNIDAEVVDASGVTRIQIADKKTGQLSYEFIYKAMTPKSRGQFEVKNPQARIYLSPSQVIHLQSEEGSFIAPGNQPQSGEFRKNLTVTYFRSTTGRRVSLAPDSPDRQAQVFLPDGATFDTTLGEIRSHGPVRVVTPVTNQMDFSGRGLRMVYNVPAARIDYLEVTEGQALHFRPRARDKKDKAHDGQGGDIQEANASSGDPDKAQYYRIDFGKNVGVTHKGNVVTAEQLVAYLSVNESQAETQAGSKPATEAPPGALDAGPPAEDADVVTITWQGKMVMVPISDPPPQVVGRDEVYVRFTGSPVTIDMEDSSRVIATEIDYLKSANRVTAAGSEVFPLRLTSPEMGEVSVPRLALDMGRNTGQLIGPGWIEAPKDRTQTIAGGKSSRGLPLGFKIVWSNGVNLTFGADAPSGSTLIESATFVGGVRAHDPRFDMHADQVTVHFVAIKEEPKLNRFDAVGNVWIKSEDAYVEAGNLRLDIDISGDDLSPQRLLAEKDVQIARGEHRIAADFLDVSFRPVTEAEKHAAKDGGKAAKPLLGDDSLSDVKVTTVLARGNVKLTQGPTQIIGDRLDADNDRGTATLRGSPLRIARLGEDPAKPQTELHVPVVQIERFGDLAFAEGAGTLVYTDIPDKPNTLPSRTVVTWSDRMGYDGKAGLIQMFGKVKAEKEESPTEVNSISANQMTLELVDPKVAEQITGGVKSERDKRGDDFEGMLGNRTLRKMTARENVRLEAQRWYDPQRQHLEMQLVVHDCALLEYTQANEWAKIPGPGKATIQQYAQPGEAPSKVRKGVQISGNGHTLFTWEKSLTFDQLNRDLIADGQVWMTHQPHGEGEVVELRSDHLIADMPAMDTTKPTQLSTVTSMDIENIKCTGNVRVRHGQRDGTADILVYDGGRNTAVFAAREGRRVEIRDPRQPRPLKAKGILWNLETDAFEIVEPMGQFQLGPAATLR